MTENKGKNGKILLKCVICAVVLAVLAEFMMILDYEGLMGAYWNKNQQRLSQNQENVVQIHIYLLLSGKYP